VSGKGQELYRQAKKRIPGGTQLFSKRPELLLPELWPGYYDRAKGAEVWDLDGKRYIDMSHNGVGTCILGAADPDVDAAVHTVIDKGTMSTLNCPEEPALAELLCEIHPWAEMVRFARCGGEAMAIAVRIARAKTKRDTVAFCGYHGWHDWYLSANLNEDSALDGHLLPGLHPAGVPRGLRGTALPFRYNHLEKLHSIAEEHEGKLAAIIMEPYRSVAPIPGFLEGVREVARQTGAILIFDEVTSGFRACPGGLHLTLSVEPDIAVFAKGMSNGYPMSAIIGRGETMSAAQDTFISSTYWTERIGPVAACATISKFRKQRVHEHLMRIGQNVQEGWKMSAEEAGLPIHIDGIPPLSHFSIDTEESNSVQTFFTQSMLERGFLASNTFYATYAHTNDHVRPYLEAVTDVFADCARLLKEGSLQSALRGPIVHSGFQRLT
jgi:glutamate-1-semialdehyde 2,1-aminomutase